MALKLYRRHRRECEGGHPEDTRSGEFEEGRRGWKKCACLIHVSGTLGGKFNRKQTGKSNWDEAKTLVAPGKRLANGTANCLFNSRLSHLRSSNLNAPRLPKHSTFSSLIGKRQRSRRPRCPSTGRSPSNLWPLLIRVAM